MKARNSPVDVGQGPPKEDDSEHHFGVLLLLLERKLLSLSSQTKFSFFLYFCSASWELFAHSRGTRSWWFNLSLSHLIERLVVVHFWQNSDE